MFYSLVSENSKFIIILLMQTDDLDRIKIKEEDSKEFESIIEYLIDTLNHNIVEKELPRIDYSQLNQLIIQNASEYKKSFSKEMQIQTTPPDPKKTIMTPEVCNRWTQILGNKWQLGTVISNVD